MSGTAEGKIPLSFDYCIRADLAMTETESAPESDETEKVINLKGIDLEGLSLSSFDGSVRSDAK